MPSSAHPPYQLGRSPGRCSITGRQLEPGETHIAALVERDGEESFERVEFSLEAWSSGARPGGLFGFWRATVPRPDDKPKLLIDDEALLELFDSLEDASGEQAAFRFVLALILMRKRLLRHVGQRLREDQREMLVRRKGEPADAPPIAVLDPDLDSSEVESIADRLEPVLRGEA